MRRRTVFAVVSVLMLLATFAVVPASAGEQPVAALGMGHQSVRGSGGVDSPPGAFMPTYLMFHDGSYYEYVFAGVPWDTAVALAEGGTLEHCSGSSHLATITSAEEQAAVDEVVLGLPNAWIGGSQAPDELDKDANWQWVTGEAFSFSNWASGEPNDNPYGTYIPGSEQHMEIYGHGQWNDAPGTEPKSYVVEYEGCDLGPSGPATFTFNVRSMMWSEQPVGSVLFRLPAADLTFRSGALEFMMLEAPYALVFGEGTVNGTPGYEFAMYVQEDLAEEFYIIISDASTGEIVYDSFQFAPMGISSGYIAVHLL